MGDFAKHQENCVRACAGLPPSVVKVVADTGGFHVPGLVKQLARQRNEMAAENALLRQQMEDVHARHAEELEALKAAHASDLELVRQDERDRLLPALKLAEGVAERVIAATGFDESQVSDWRPVVRDAIAAVERSATIDAIQSVAKDHAGITPEAARMVLEQRSERDKTRPPSLRAALAQSTAGAIAEAYERG